MAKDCQLRDTFRSVASEFARSHEPKYRQRDSWEHRDPEKRRGPGRVRVRLGPVGHVGSMSGLPESGHDWAIYEYTP